MIRRRASTEAGPETPRILVVDDEPRNQTAIAGALEELDVELSFASTGDDALRQLLADDFAVILLDVRMPGLDGFETARLIRARAHTAHVPILLMTAYRQDDADIRRGYGLGAVDYLFKPLIPEILQAKVQAFVDLRNRTAEVQRQAERLREIERLDGVRRLAEERRRWEAASLRNQMEEQRRINTQLAEMDRRKNQFIALLAHELRNPLAPLVTSLEVLRARLPEDPLLVRVRDAMDRQVRHLTRLVDDLLDVSRISSDKLELRTEPMDLRRAVDDALEACRPAIDQDDLEVILVSSEKDVIVDGDHVRLTQVLTNLLTNAARYSERGGRITVRWGIDGEQGLVSVADQGRGIAPEFIGRVFDMFAQERDGGHGLGLGLTLVKQLVEMHGGSVAARSEGRGKGSEFVIRLPLTQARSARAAPAASPPPPARRPALRIAVVEDDVDICDGLRLLFETWGHQVMTAPSGTRGLELVLAKRPDLALLDIGLPGLDGYGVAERIRAALGEDAPPLVALTGFGQHSDRARSRDAGFIAHLVKPSSPQELQGVLDAVHRTIDARPAPAGALHATSRAPDPAARADRGDHGDHDDQQQRQEETTNARGA